MTEAFPYLTAQIPPINGTAKSDYLDFFVEEIPLYQPSGVGDHVYFVVEKQGITTLQAAREIAFALGIRPRDIGVAGQKDARGLTRQLMSAEHQDPNRVAALEIPRIRILAVSRHGNKLRTGHLRGNRFVLKMRDWDESRLRDVETVMAILSDRGVPNYYGPQRFGYRGDTHAVGLLLLKGDFEAACRLIAGAPNELDTGRTLTARRLFDEGNFKEASNAWPRGFREAEVVAKGMDRFKGDAKRALLSLDKKMLGFYVSAYQSRVFNRVLGKRIAELDTVEKGDVAAKLENGAMFLVEDEDAEKPRAERFEISATGPIFGAKMKQPDFRILALETGMLAEEGGTPALLSQKGVLGCRGGRRPLREKLDGVDVRTGSDDRGGYLQLSFSLPSGSYATSVLREVFKEGLVLSEGPRSSVDSKKINIYEKL